jgi:probable rRNA maturation factor
MIKVDIRNLTRKKLPQHFLKRITRKILEKELGVLEASVSLVFVGQKRAKDLNLLFRKKDYPANVLSFEGGNFQDSFKKEKFLGEIVLCPAFIEKEAKSFGFQKENFLIFCLIHGLLHLLGYDHSSGKEKKLMAKKESEYFNEFKLN